MADEIVEKLVQSLGIAQAKEPSSVGWKKIVTQRKQENFHRIESRQKNVTRRKNGQNYTMEMKHI